MSLLRLHKVSKTYEDGATTVLALKDLSLEVREGEFVVIAGPSGSGKTTLMNVMGTLDHPDSGMVYLDDREISGLSPNTLAEVRLRQIGFVFQSLNLIDVLTARENVEYVMLLQGVAPRIRRERATAILKSLGLEGLIDRSAYRLSGGERQRVAIARAVAGKPRMILADEPTANLDSENGRSLIELMERFNRSEGMTFMIASHDPMVIGRAGRVILLKDGTIEKDEVAPEIRADDHIP